MASSRRSASSVERALAALAPARLVVAFSGGLDSTVLLHAAARVLGADRIVAAHVHHGLQAAADAWPAHCAREARALGVAYRCLRLAPAPASGANLEAWAREQRYRALARLARRVGAVAILTAHHADDQVETMLMRLARGTGIDGLSGIAARATLGGATVIRPLLDLPRACLAEHARIYGLRWIEDPSNRDLGRTRNAIRHRVLPALEAAVPGLSAALLAALPRIRAARDAQDASAQQDLARARSGAGLDRRALAGLSLERRHAALRAWLRSQGLRMPGVARLREIDRQLIGAEGACGRVLHDGVALLRYRNDLVACKASSLDAPPPTRVELQWRGEPAIDLPGDAGRLLVEPVRATTMA
ncbi:MAG: tRNA lysidine(34) synthetase TilS, partial [Burkholderiaceae bacterium]|nr:tRNA lysidine(34) synthetase TilS [Burkholderiaceae bacterium]